MKEELKAALAAFSAGDMQAVTAAAEAVKLFPRTEDGLFEWSKVDDNLFEAARWIYPVYAAFETECNKKEGYPDLIEQVRVLDRTFSSYIKEAKKEEQLTMTACYLNALIYTIENVSPQLYEYYSEMVTIFKGRVNEAITKFWTDGANLDDAAAEEMIRGAIRLAGEKYVLLAEKYEAYC